MKKTMASLMNYSSYCFIVSLFKGRQISLNFIITVYLVDERKKVIILRFSEYLKLREKAKRDSVMRNDQ